ncbi:hypothetical protein HMN09_01311400 [Mycena chlorophos]|uniref:F-box domain-containing protein n=1 Tax=Mycena chlorophos TaxID=658473 RepID=A0A8H6S0G9_MYCCL|nr:hypothetical protein HMN09_01311400 [Mycena chlorophos]
MEPHSHTPPRLPLELLLMICNEAADSLETLARLCRTWRAFLAPSQRLMYCDVDLEAKSLKETRSWALAVSRHTHLAERVQSLSLRLPDVPQLSPTDSAKIGHALFACVNLKRLDFLRATTGAVDWRTSNLDFVLHMCDFQLTRFTTSYFSFGSELLRIFLAKQNELRFLAVLPGSWIDPQMLEANPRPALPNLIGFKGDAFMIPENRPFQRLELFYNIRLPGLHQYADTLTTLNLISRSESTQGVSLVSLSSIVRTLPLLRHLGLMSTAQAREPRSLGSLLVAEKLPLTATWLETVAVVDRCSKVTTKTVLYGAARNTLETHSSLRRVAIGANVAKAGEMMCIVTRDGDATGEVETKMVKEIDFERVSMFWA